MHSWGCDGIGGVNETRIWCYGCSSDKIPFLVCRDNKGRTALSFIFCSLYVLPLSFLLTEVLGIPFSLLWHSVFSCSYETRWTVGQDADKKIKDVRIQYHSYKNRI